MTTGRDIRAGNPSGDWDLLEEHETHFGTRDHTVICLPYDRVQVVQAIDIFCFDPPGLPEDADFDETRRFMQDLVTWCNEYRNPGGCSLVIIPRDRKGHPYQKSIVTAYEFQSRGWEVVRQLTWMTGYSDFHRARYAAQPIWVMRKGHRPMNSKAHLRYKDVVRVPDLFTEGGMEMGFPRALIEMLLELVSTDESELVCDPFAGSGIVARVAKQRGQRSLSIDIDREACLGIVQRLKG